MSQSIDYDKLHKDFNKDHSKSTDVDLSEGSIYLPLIKGKLYGNIQHNPNYKIYVDLDGVLVDFNKGYSELTGIDLEKNPDIPPYKFWPPIHKAGEEWWENLEWMPEGRKLWNYVEKYRPQILSAPSRSKSSITGKEKWMDKNLPHINLILRKASKKRDFAETFAILIDDRESNVSEWIESGGIGILFKSTDQTINELKKLGL